MQVSLALTSMFIKRYSPFNHFQPITRPFTISPPPRIFHIKFSFTKSFTGFFSQNHLEILYRTPKLLLFFQQNPVPPNPIIALFPYATPFTISLSNQKPINLIKTT